MRTKKYYSLLEPLLGRSYFTLKQAEELGVPRQAVIYLSKKEILEKVFPGAYRFVGYESETPFEWENLAIMASSIPNGIICLISALCYYDLTDEMMREAWIAIPNGSKSPVRDNTRIISMRNISLGINEIQIGEYKVKIFDEERSVVDAFRYLSKETSLKALKKYLNRKEKKPSIDRLISYSKQLRVDLSPYILAYTT